MKPAALPRSSLRTIIAALIVAAGAAALVACAAGGARKTSMVGAAPSDAAAGDGAATPLSGRPAELRARITELDQAIDEQLAEAQLERPDAAMAATMSATPMTDVRATCDHSASASCQDVCRLSDSICDNAESICELADQLPGDAWASEKCDGAKASCKLATERCCEGQCAATP